MLRTAAAAAATAFLGLTAACGGGTTSAGNDVSSVAPAPSSPAPAAPSGSVSTAAPPPSATSAGTGRDPQADPSARCTADDLSLRIGRPDAGAGQIHATLTFTNTGKGTCTLKGFPGVSLLAGDGSAVGRPATREGGGRPAHALGPGRSAGVDLHTLNQGIRGDSCWPQPAMVKVYPPGSKQALTLRADQFRVCGGTFTTTAVQ